MEHNGNAFLSTQQYYSDLNNDRALRLEKTKNRQVDCM